MLSEEEISSHITKRLNILLTRNPNTIDTQDKEGSTALHYATGSHAGCGNSDSHLTTKFPCENGGTRG
ncbi:hypothetical protein ASPWEDRAFT_41079 [Aspergillus wentii DTO 134E9]|uniref:Uncharacterized protein n=1 Tax=Aspergillus wentii DTO 134E9 TaxID=1073089 RepID=A0A1L9RLT2_ASPWE|nr:uncharacterized protein ASPWEDRAFT_41079 [Aspergillus wentii DTO 134E9]OJJ35843.1 hypothetical protein ASPWEDRAFT_41079 [Aspergillus wentii DTO 134E9]